MFIRNHSYWPKYELGVTVTVNKIVVYKKNSTRAKLSLCKSDPFCIFETYLNNIWITLTLLTKNILVFNIIIVVVYCAQTSEPDSFKQIKHEEY